MGKVSTEDNKGSHLQRGTHTIQETKLQKQSTKQLQVATIQLYRTQKVIQ